MVAFTAATTRALFLIFFSYLATPVVSLSFNYSTFSTDDRNNIKIEGDASFSVGWIDISANRYNGIEGSNGRAWYSAQPMLLWDKATGEVASFTTRFTFAIVGDINNKGQGMAFFLTGQSSLPAKCPSYNLGLTNQSPGDLASGDSRFVAVEFDTFNNTDVSDPNTTYDHIGIDVNSLVSVETLPLKSFDLMYNLTAEIKYNNVSSILTATVWLGDDKYGQPRGRSYMVSSEVDLKSSLPEQVSVGFSASTSTSAELHQLHSWSFNSSLGPPSPSSSPPPLPPPSSMSMSEVDLMSALPEQVSIGFSASTFMPTSTSMSMSTSTSTSVELHQLHSWSFSSSLDSPSPPSPPFFFEESPTSPSPSPSPSPPPSSSPSPPPPTTSPPPSSSPSPRPPTTSPPGQGPGSGVIAGAAAGAAMFLVLLFAVVATLLVRHRRRRNVMETEENYTDLECEGKPMTEIEMGTGPRRFSYQELVEATSNFAAEEKLGQGGFGTVYRGYLRGELAGLAVAIKRFSNSKPEESSMQGEREYKSEIKVISKLRHRNLVQLLGWCHGHGELLLVYELMPNCSLDIHLHSKQGTFLTWPMRMKILLELGSALLYLHEEWEQRVLHRDIKPSNVMLDESFGAKLGDFGLARLVDHAAGMQTMTVISGTRGYLDPECVNTGRASAESDMYSFGVVLLEVASGRRPMSISAANQDQQMNGGVFRLVEWVWGLYGQGAILDATDERLNDDYNAAEVERVMVVGLWCAHPNPSARPSIRTAMATLQPKVNQACYQLPVLPSKMPVPMYEPSPPLAWANVVGMSSSSFHTVGMMSSSTLSSMPPHTSITTSSDASTSATSSKTSSSLLKRQYP